MTKCELERENSILLQHVANLKIVNEVLAEKLITSHYYNYHSKDTFLKLKAHLPREVFLKAEAKMHEASDEY